MFLQKTSLRIKQYIAHRRSNSQELAEGDVPDGRVTVKRSPLNPSKRLSWLSQSSPAEGTGLQRADSNATTRTLPNVPSALVHSSASSLCSCDCDAVRSPDQNSLPTSCQPPTNSDARCLQPPCIAKMADQRKPGSYQSQTVYLKPLSGQAFSKSYATGISRSPTLDLLEALAIDPVDEDKTPTPSIKTSNGNEMESFSENVERLIRETDQAFHAVGSALADAKAATHGWYDVNDGSQQVRLSGVSRGMVKKLSRSPESPLKTQISRPTSFARGRKKNAAKKRIILLDKPGRKAPPPPANTPTRWTLTDMTPNMTDALGGKTVRTEADGTWKPSKSQQIDKRHGIVRERRASVESASSVDTNGSTPTDPFHLEDLSARIGSTLDTSNLPISEAPVPSPPTPPRSARRPPSQQKARTRMVKFSETGDEESSMVYKDLNFPSPPRTPLPRANVRSASILPTIPEISPISAPFGRSFAFSADVPHLYNKAPVSEPTPHNYVLLPSTTFTLTSPLFRHGSIRLDRVRDLKRSVPRKEAPLDWTAFQMAISGTVDHDGRDPEDNSTKEADEKEVDGIVEWFTGFGFQGYGKLRKGVPKKKRKRGHGKGKVAHECSNKLPNSVETLQNVHDLQLEVDRHPKKQGTMDSLPPSPMLELMLPDSRGDEVVPMGFNLGHDLGDFLDWETRHAQKLPLKD